MAEEKKKKTEKAKPKEEKEKKKLKAGKKAEAKNLKIAGGLMSRHYIPLEQAVQKLHDGIIGDLITCTNLLFVSQTTPVQQR